MGTMHKDRNLLLFPLLSVADDAGFNADLSSLCRTGQFFQIVRQFIDDYCSQNPSFPESLSEADDISLPLKSLVEYFLTESSEYSSDDVLLFGISCLFGFIQINFTGPGPDKLGNHDEILQYLVSKSTSVPECWPKRYNDSIRNALCSGDDIFFEITEQPILLFLAKLIFTTLPESLQQQWWLMRSLYIHQLVLQDPSPTIHEQLVTVTRFLDSALKENTDKELLVLFYLEKIQIHLQLYSETSDVKDLAHKIRSRLHLKEVKLDGRLGKRTRYQQKNVAQLFLQVEVGPETSSIENGVDETLSPAFSAIDYRCSRYPEDKRLDDDVRLPEIQFADETEEPISLNVIQQSAILALFMVTKKSEPKDEILSEKLSAYLSYLLSDPKSWNIQATALLQRSLLEVESSRTVERSLLQIQSLISEFDEPCPELSERLPLAFCSFIVPKRDLDVNLAKLLVQLGAIQSALDIYLRLAMWEEIVACYNHLKLRHKAAEVIRNEMTKGGKTVQLCCLLGDATDDIGCYEEAWELSGCKSARAQKHWALYLFRRKQYKESIPHFQTSLEINSLQVSLWFNYGYAALVLEDWELSAKAYRRYCSLEPDSFEAWNNLAKACIKLGQKNRAWCALQEAVKCNYDNWKVWDNLMAVSADCADFSEISEQDHVDEWQMKGRVAGTDNERVFVIRCYRRILDIKGKHVDNEVLEIMVNAIRNKLPECDSPALRKAALQLFGRLTSMVTNDSKLWKLYAALTESEEVDVLNQTKVVQYLMNAQKVAFQKPGWEQTVEGCRNVVDVSMDLSLAQRKCASWDVEQRREQYLSSSRRMLQAVASMIKRTHTDALDELNEELTADVKRIEFELDEIKKLGASAS